jgi:hypothetical protein
MIGADDRAHRFVVHDRDSTYSDGVDRSLAAMDLTVLKTPVRSFVSGSVMIIGEGLTPAWDQVFRMPNAFHQSRFWEVSVMITDWHTLREHCT